MTWNWQDPDWPNWRFDPERLAAREDRFLLGAGALAGSWKHLAESERDALRIDLLSREALETSAIEGEVLDRDSVQSSLRRAFGLTAPLRPRPAESGIAELMVEIFRKYADPVTHETLWRWHRLVCRGRDDLADLGGYRTHAEAMQVVSGRLDRPTVHFEAPPSVQMLPEMTRFLDWLAASGGTVRPLARAGLAHLWFVSVHPFEDGNGRIARALSEKALAEALGGPSLIALSQTIQLNRRAYYAELEANNRDLTIDVWLGWFADICLEAQARAQAMIDFIIAKTRLLDTLRGKLNPRQEKALLRMFEAGPDGFKGGLSARNYATITGAAPATVTRDLRGLVESGALTRTGERKSARYWLNL